VHIACFVADEDKPVLNVFNVTNTLEPTINVKKIAAITIIDLVFLLPLETGCLSTNSVAIDMFHLLFS